MSERKNRLYHLYIGRRSGYEPNYLIADDALEDSQPEDWFHPGTENVERIASFELVAGDSFPEVWPKHPRQYRRR